jgi:hypothetical protein
MIRCARRCGAPAVMLNANSEPFNPDVAGQALTAYGFNFTVSDE